MIERTFAFGRQRALVGTLCLPQPGATPQAGLGVVLFNAGVLGRIGPHRLNVRLARALAARGVPSIRFDLSGMGDSQRPRDGLPYEQQAVEDLRRAIDELCAASGVGKVALFGFCSGGRHGYNAVQSEPRIAGLIMHDTYAHRTPRSLAQKYIHRFQHYGAATVLGGWLRRGPRRLLGMVMGGQGDAAAGQANVDPSDVTPAREAFAQRLRELHGRGVKVGLIFSGEGELYNYPDQHRDAYKGLGIDGLYTCDYLPHMDHNAMLLKDQAAFIALIEGWVLELAARHRGAPPESLGARA